MNGRPSSLSELYKLYTHGRTGIYILQNTMVGGGDGWLGKKNENEELGKKKGKKKGGKLHEKSGKRP